MTRALQALRSYAVDFGFGHGDVPPAPRRRHSMSDIRADLVACCCKAQGFKAVHQGWTGDDSKLPMPLSWKRSAFVTEPATPRTPIPAHDLLDGKTRLALLEEAELFINVCPWVRNDETPWGTLGTRPEGEGTDQDPHFFAMVGTTLGFHNEFRAWLDHTDAKSFATLFMYASMNCSDFVTLSFASIANVAPERLASHYNRQALDEPRPRPRFSYRYNHLGAPYRRDFDEKAFPGDLVFWESRKHGVHHVAILQETQPKRLVIENFDREKSFYGVTAGPLKIGKNNKISYVPFEVAMRSFLAHMNEPGGLYKRLGYDAFLRLIPRV